MNITFGKRSKVHRVGYPSFPCTSRSALCGNGVYGWTEGNDSWEEVTCKTCLKMIKERDNV